MTCGVLEPAVYYNLNILFRSDLFYDYLEVCDIFELVVSFNSVSDSILIYFMIICSVASLNFMISSNLDIIFYDYLKTSDTFRLAIHSNVIFIFHLLIYVF